MMKRFRDAVLGRFTTREYAVEHPDTTVSESVDPLANTVDAQVWARELMRRLVDTESPYGVMAGSVWDKEYLDDFEHFLLGWFANAMQAAAAHERARS